jgi:hypothetical protein
MADNLSTLIAIIKQTSVVQSKPEFYSIFESIEKFAENDSELAYMMGTFFKHKFDSDNLPHDVKHRLIQSIRDENLEGYFYLKLKPLEQHIALLAWVFIILGTIAIIVGIFQMVAGGILIGVNLRFLAFVVDDGRYKVLLGLLFLLLGALRYKRENAKKRFIRQLK